LLLPRVRKLIAVGNQLNSSDAEVRDKDASGVAKHADKGVSQFSRVILQLTNTSEKGLLSLLRPASLGPAMVRTPNQTIDLGFVRKIRPFSQNR
tara:strand:+ start:521 stop:802 length:282 start_codon:yes stop_codon:yes gene_type:complete